MTTRDELAERFYREQDWHSCNGISLGPYITRTFKAGYDACAAERDGEIVSLKARVEEEEQNYVDMLELRDEEIRKRTRLAIRVERVEAERNRLRAALERIREATRGMTMRQPIYQWADEALKEIGNGKENT